MIGKSSRLFLATFLVAFSSLVLMSCGEIFEDEGPEGTSNGGGSTHNSGRDCTSCHDDVEYAGTIYSDASGSSRVSGATIVVTQNNGDVITMISDRSGNFWSNSGNAGVGYSVAIPGNSVDMVVKPTSGACSSGGCHDGSSTARVYAN